MNILGSKSLQAIIKDLLIKKPHLRDDDNKLLANVWFLATKPLKEEWLDFLALIADGKLPTPSAITRCRRKMQEMHPVLRGEMWYKRHDLQEQVKIELKEMEKW